MDTTNFYTILGISKEFTDKEIKKKFRDLSKIHHPDKGGDGEVFKLISKAYEVLTNPKKRAKYDAGGDFESIVSDEEEAYRRIDAEFDFFVNNAGSGFNPETVNIFKKVEGRINGKIGQLQKQIEDAECDRENLFAIKPRILSGARYIKRIDSHISGINKFIENSKAEIEVLNLSLGFLEGLEYKIDEDNYMVQWEEQNGTSEKRKPRDSKAESTTYRGKSFF